MIGETIGRKFAVVRRLGVGGMGAVYEARHVGTGRRVALKIVHPEIARDPRAVARFEREARAAGAIESEHIVQILDVGLDEVSGAPFLAMEYLVGEDVEQLFARLGPVTVDLALSIGVEACAGLERAHAGGVVHRDIKPANLFLCEQANGERIVKLLDFGIAKVDDGELGPEQKKRPLTKTGALLGSPLYMSPEQARGKGSLDHRTDLWSLGVVLYQALAGRTPFDDTESVGEFILTVCSTPVTPLTTAAPWVDAAVAAAIERALRIDLRERYASAAEMRAALAVFLADGARIRPSMLVPAATAAPARSAVATAEPPPVSTGSASGQAVVAPAPGAPSSLPSGPAPIPALGLPASISSEVPPVPIPAVPARTASTSAARHPPRTRRRRAALAGVLLITLAGGLGVVRALGLLRHSRGAPATEGLDGSALTGGLLGAACQDDRDCLSGNCAPLPHVCAPAGRAKGEPCLVNAQCASHWCLGTVCQ